MTELWVAGGLAIGFILGRRFGWGRESVPAASPESPSRAAIRLLDTLEDSAERLADAFVAMRDARRQLAERRKKRQYGAPLLTGPSSSGPPSSRSPRPGRRIAPPAGGFKKREDIADRKRKSVCWACGQHGHWSGDPQCAKS